LTGVGVHFGMSLSGIAGGGRMLSKDVLGGKGHDAVAGGAEERVSVTPDELDEHGIGALVVDYH
jgi:hypothetical protein